jgi:hypothetical protein
MMGSAIDTILLRAAICGVLGDFCDRIDWAARHACGVQDLQPFLGRPFPQGPLHVGFQQVDMSPPQRVRLIVVVLQQVRPGQCVCH